jgi:SecD/SecF fusion protein
MRTSPLRLFAYLLVVGLGLLFAWPNLLTKEQAAHLPGFLPSRQVALGLDLRGGSHLVLEVDSAALVRERVQDVASRTRELLRRADISPSITQGRTTIDVRLANPDQMRPALNILRQAWTGAAPDAGQIDLEKQGPEQIRIALSEAGIRDRVNAAAEQSLEIVRRRIDQIGVAEPTIQRVGADRILVQLPGVQDPGHIRTMLGSTAKLTFHMLTDSPVGARTLPGADDGQSYRIQSRSAMAGDRLKDARMGFDERMGQPVINFRLDSRGAKQFSDITRANVGRPFAIVLDGKVLSAPVINEHIGGGSGQISGRFTTQQASDLAALLRAGALPAPLTVIEERTVGPDLGADAIARGIETGLAGFALVAAFMLLLYGGWGLLANLALLLNVVLTLAALTAMGATLTLPGLAGMVLSIGLAVDANVLINERIREESRKGASALAALDLGFRRAYSTIIDSNLTALIATSLLFYLGSGPVRGFAVTMGLGIGISLFTAVAVVRVLMSAIARRKRLSSIRIAPLLPARLIPDGTTIPFMRARFFGIALSAILSLASVLLFFSPGLNYGIDFKGGIQVQTSLSSPLALNQVRGSLDRLGLGEISLQEFGESGRLLIRAERQPGGEAEQTAALEKIRAAVRTLDRKAVLESSEVVGPKVSGELAYAGVLAVFLASLAMLAYIWIRFEWHFAIGAIATLVLDVTKTVGFFAVTGLEFNLTAIAALLTLIGYSVNDKVVVYDRMRENLRLFRNMSLRDLIDRSINETLARSLYTSVTAFLAMLPMAIWGGPAVSSFAIPMAFGIAIAASSSVFIAAPILLFLGDWRKRRAVRGPRPGQVVTGTA